MVCRIWELHNFEEKKKRLSSEIFGGLKVFLDYGLDMSLSLTTSLKNLIALSMSSYRLLRVKWYNLDLI